MYFDILGSNIITTLSATSLPFAIGAPDPICEDDDIMDLLELDTK